MKGPFERATRQGMAQVLSEVSVRPAVQVLRFFLPNEGGMHETRDGSLSAMPA